MNGKRRVIDSSKGYNFSVEPYLAAKELSYKELRPSKSYIAIAANENICLHVNLVN